MAVPERDTVYTNDGTNRTSTTYTRESSATGWFVGIIVALALLAIGYLVFSANSGPAPTTSVDVNNTPAVVDTTPTAPATGVETTPMAPADEVAPATTGPDAAAPAEAAPAETAPAGDAVPLTTEPAPATP